MPRRSAPRVWICRIVAVLAVAGLVGHLWAVGLDRADKLGSAAGLVVAILGLVTPYLLSARPPPTTGAETPAAGEPPAGPPPGIDARHSQGVQINLGGTSTQTNTFGPR
jgi:hypothetical protein